MCKTMRYPLMLGLLLVIGGCPAQNDVKPYKTLAKDSRRDTEKATRLNAKAMDELAKNDLKEAQEDLTAALTADMFYGPGHNNLGLLYYRQKKYYLAAWEFQYAIRLMPTKALPKANLGMVFEAVGKIDDAARYYEEALKIEPDDVQTIGNLARVYVRDNRKDQRTREILNEIVMKDTRPDWVSWAKERIAILGKPGNQPTTQP